jgi:hypothetical protein
LPPLSIPLNTFEGEKKGSIFLSMTSDAKTEEPMFTQVLKKKKKNIAAALHRNLQRGKVCILSYFPFRKFTHTVGKHLVITKTLYEIYIFIN